LVSYLPQFSSAFPAKKSRNGLNLLRFSLLVFVDDLLLCAYSV
jgi:hypothetical protein